MTVSHELREFVDRSKRLVVHEHRQLVVTDEETINTRSNKWDVSTERSASDRRDEQNEERREELRPPERRLRESVR